jgi:hypothetical protein
MPRGRKKEAKALRDEYTRTIGPARALAAETLALERTLSDLVNQAYALAPAEIALMWQTAPPRKPIPPPATSLERERCSRRGATGQRAASERGDA